MRITSVECYLGNFITVKVNTDEGIYGWGEAGLAYGNCWEAAFGQCQDFAKLVIGMDPFDTEKNLGASASAYVLGNGRGSCNYLCNGGD